MKLRKKDQQQVHTQHTHSIKSELKLENFTFAFALNVHNNFVSVDFVNATSTIVDINTQTHSQQNFSAAATGN